MKSRITFVLSTLTGGGAERVTLNIINNLDREKYEICLILLQNYGEYLDQIPKDIEVEILDVKRTLFSFAKLRKVIKKQAPDILYATLFHTGIALYLSTIGMRAKPKIVLRNATSPKLVMQNGDIGLLYRLALQWIYNKVDMVIAQTPEMKEEMVEYFHTDPQHIEVFLNPLDIDRIESALHHISNPFDEKKTNIVAAGRMSYEKGFDILLDAFAKVIREEEHFYLHIIGKDEGEYQRLLKQVAALSLEEHVKIWGFQDNPYRFFYFSDLYVLPSRREGLPNTVLENLYIGKPVVATDCVPFIHRLIDDGKNGYIVDVEDRDALAKAILAYKQLSMESPAFIFAPGDPNTLFAKLISREKGVDDRE